MTALDGAGHFLDWLCKGHVPRVRRVRRVFHVALSKGSELGSTSLAVGETKMTNWEAPGGNDASTHDSSPTVSLISRWFSLSLERSNGLRSMLEANENVVLDELGFLFRRPLPNEDIGTVELFK